MDLEVVSEVALEEASAEALAEVSEEVSVEVTVVDMEAVTEAAAAVAVEFPPAMAPPENPALTRNLLSYLGSDQLFHGGRYPPQKAVWWCWIVRICRKVRMLGNLSILGSPFDQFLSFVGTSDKIWPVFNGKTTDKLCFFCVQCFWHIGKILVLKTKKKVAVLNRRVLWVFQKCFML